ncbi:MAG: restriction endonuclease subunit S [Prolixibacteraceae bacterium]|nr:restriction endonuclease subunit S [Prolixibacteraceae bacterium]
MSKEKILIPELRFPEFVKDGEWEGKTVGQVYNFKVTNSLSREYLNYEKGKVKNIHYGDIHTKFNTLFDITNEEVPFINLDVSIENIKKESYCIEGDIILADASEDLNDVGKSIEIVNLNNEKLVSGLHTLLARQREKKLTIGFGGYLFKSNWVRKQIQKEAQGAKVLGISTGRIANVQISFPQKTQEQQKIASCLSSLDELITAHNDKLDALKDHKKGLMQNLFPHPSASSGSGTVAEPVEAKVPNYRFPEFEGDGEWEKKKLGEIGEPLMCKRIFKDQTTPNPENGIPFYKIGTFGKEADAYIPEDLYIEYMNKYNYPNKGDILISASGTIGRLVIYEGSPAYYQDSNIVWLGHDESLVTNEFLFYCYLMVNWQTSDGGVIKRLYNSDLKNVSICFPENDLEQQKIASCLSALDELITAQAKKIEQLQQHKKGLMQGLFPKTQSLRT